MSNTVKAHPWTQLARRPREKRRTALRRYRQYHQQQEVLRREMHKNGSKR